MMQAGFRALGGLFLAALLSSPTWGATPPQPGTVNYVEGAATINGQPLSDKSAGAEKLAAGQTIATTDGRIEILLVPGIFFRLDKNSSAEMVNPGLADTVLSVQKGRAMVEVAEIRRENDVRLMADGASTQLLKPGLYDVNADQREVRVFDGKAEIRKDDQRIELKGGHELALDTSTTLKPQKFDKKAAEDDFYRWASLRSSYLAEANVDAARTYVVQGGWGPGWYGSGWYWNPWFDAYTFVPASGIFYDPFGWSFYSPAFVYAAPYFGYGYGAGRYYRHFGPGYRPLYGQGFHGPVFSGHAPSVGRGRLGGFTAAPSAGFGGRTGGFAGGGFHGGFASGRRR